MLKPSMPTPEELGAKLDRLVGRYRFEGTEASGKFELVRRGVFLHLVGDRVGLGLPWQGRVVVVFGPLNKTEIGAYRVGKEGEVVGLWVPPGADQADLSACGVEVSAADEQGLWRIQSAYAIDKSPYTGKIERTVMHGTDANPPRGVPRAVHVLWRLEDGDFRSFALDFTSASGGALYSMFCFEPEQEHGLAVYEMDKAYARGEGWVMTSTGRGAQPEVLTRE